MESKPNFFSVCVKLVHNSPIKKFVDIISTNSMETKGFINESTPIPNKMTLITGGFNEYNKNTIYSEPSITYIKMFDNFFQPKISYESRKMLIPELEQDALLSEYMRGCDYVKKEYNLLEARDFMMTKKLQFLLDNMNINIELLSKNFNRDPQYLEKYRVVIEEAGIEYDCAVGFFLTKNVEAVDSVENNDMFMFERIEIPETDVSSLGCPKIGIEDDFGSSCGRLLLHLNLWRKFKRGLKRFKEIEKKRDQIYLGNNMNAFRFYK
ncbi:2515_t:CDS:2 [Funneliformis geosporum]|uniref:17709_t:CDS:1 n=1 Tax=Funneliformis geosporum TaxID=1117311 RepID=A0A9W4SNH1_9GLOM|nr:17709_t:CDS:2 [Funneliformis geosporum]CAI2183474.1 2515_t:CDS:2 [Funneliformis geosporum]